MSVKPGTAIAGLARTALRSDVTRAMALVVLAFLASNLLPASAQTVPLRAEAVAPGVWALVGTLGGPHFDNHALNATYGVVATPDGTIVVDSGASAQGAEIIAQMALKLTGQPVRWVFNTGSQHHRWWGNDHFRKLGAQVIAHQRTVQTQRALVAGQSLELQTLLRERFGATQALHADRTAQGERTQMTLGGVRIELLDLGDAHFPGDAVVWLPASRVAFAGDVVYVERLLSFAPQSDGPAWLKAFERLMALAPAHVVPGHGAPTSLATVQAQTGAYLRFIVAGVQRHAKEMAGVEAALAEMGDAPAFSGLANYAQLHRANVNRAYLRAELAN